MKDIYLVDFENVASEGLNGITSLTAEDEVIIFYSNNANRLTMKMHILIGQSACRFEYFEVSAGGKNAMDHQIATWLGFLIGTNATEGNYYIVSKDTGYRHVANFWAEHAGESKIRCIGSIRFSLDARRQEIPAQPVQIEEQAEVIEIAADIEEPVLSVEEEPNAHEYVEEAVPETSEEIHAEEETSVQPEAADVPSHLEQKSRRSRNRSNTRRNRSRSRNGARNTTAATATLNDENKDAQTADENPIEPVELEAPAEVKPAKLNPAVRKEASQNEGVRTAVGSLIANYPNLHEEQLQQLIHDNKRQVLCNTLRKQLGQENGLALYNQIKKIAWR